MLRDELAALLEPVVRGLGYELWELEYSSRLGNGVLRLYIESVPGRAADLSPDGAGDGGITVEDCARVSQAVSQVLDAEDPLPGTYTLEVSSPGLDRVLRTAAHFERFTGAEVRVETRLPVAGRKRFTGRLAAVKGGLIVLDMEADGGRIELPIDGLHKARLVPEL